MQDTAEKEVKLAPVGEVEAADPAEFVEISKKYIASVSRDVRECKDVGLLTPHRTLPQHRR